MLPSSAGAAAGTEMLVCGHPCVPRARWGKEGTVKLCLERETSEKVLLSKLCPGLINRPVHDHGAAMKVWMQWRGQWWGGGCVTWSWQQEIGRQGPSPQPGFNLWPSAKCLASVSPCASCWGWSSWAAVVEGLIRWQHLQKSGGDSEGILKTQMYLASVDTWGKLHTLHGLPNSTSMDPKIIGVENWYVLWYFGSTQISCCFLDSYW